MVQGTPEVVVNGRYRVSASMAGSQEGMLQVANFLIEQERARQQEAEAEAATETTTASS